MGRRHRHLAWRQSGAHSFIEPKRGLGGGLPRARPHPRSLAAGAGAGSTPTVPGTEPRCARLLDRDGCGGLRLSSGADLSSVRPRQAKPILIFLVVFLLMACKPAATPVPTAAPQGLPTPTTTLPHTPTPAPATSTPTQMLTHTPTPVPPTATPTPTPYLTTDGGVNVRSGPGTVYPLIRVARPGHKYAVLGVSPVDGEEWFAIDLNGDGKCDEAGGFIAGWLTELHNVDRDHLLIVEAPANLSLSEDWEGAIEDVTCPSQAIYVLRYLDYEYLVSDVRTNESTGIRQTTYRLPPEIVDNDSIVLALGQQLPTRFGDRLPEGVVAVVSQFPEEAVGAAGPFVWVNANAVSEAIYGTDMVAVYQSQRYPANLLAEIYIQEPFRDRPMPFRPTDRVGDFVGEELAAGAIRQGSIYLCVDRDGSWEQREYPDIPVEGDAVNLLWDFNPMNPETGDREFDAPIFLRQQQVYQRAITLESPQHDVGPSIIFRTDQTTGQTDVVAFAPYLYLSNVELLRDIVYNTPLADGSLPEPDDLIVAGSDLHLTSNGEMGPILGPDEGAVTIGGGPVSEGPVDVSGVNNHTGFYIGIP